MAVHPASAQFMTGGDLIKSCQSAKHEQITRCLGYVAGVIDYHVMMQSLGTTPTTDFCLPQNLPIEAAALEVLTYLQHSPQDQGFIAAPSVTMALHNIYPCAPPKAKKKRKK